MSDAKKRKENIQNKPVLQPSGGYSYNVDIVVMTHQTSHQTPAVVGLINTYLTSS